MLGYQQLKSRVEYHFYETNYELSSLPHHVDFGFRGQEIHDFEILKKSPFDHDKVFVLLRGLKSLLDKLLGLRN